MFVCVCVGGAREQNHQLIRHLLVWMQGLPNATRLTKEVLREHLTGKIVRDVTWRCGSKTRMQMVQDYRCASTTTHVRGDQCYVSSRFSSWFSAMHRNTCAVGSVLCSTTHLRAGQWCVTSHMCYVPSL